MLLMVFGVLAIWMAVLIWQRQQLGFWLNTVILGMVDAAFIHALLWPGYTSLADGLPGPILYVLGSSLPRSDLPARQRHLRRLEMIGDLAALARIRRSQHSALRIPSGS